MYKLSLAHLYPKLLNLYGDLGNITTLKMRCKWRNIELSITPIDIDENINPQKYDIYFIGGGQDLQQSMVAQQLQNQKTALKDAAEQNAVFLAICGGYQLLGEYYQPHDGKKLYGAGLLDAYTIAGKTRFIGNVTAETSLTSPRTLVGFENHSGLTFLKEGTKPLAKIQIGNGNNGTDKTEGARKNNIFGTYLHGAFLPKNVHFADYLIELALEKKYKEKVQLKQLNDSIETKTHENLIGKKY